MMNTIVRVQITDSGKGMSKAIQAQIFEPFSTTNPSGEGSGMKLDICKKIIDKYESLIAVTSQMGKTMFTISLPLFRQQ